jgi:hypothetical protein
VARVNLSDVAKAYRRALKDGNGADEELHFLRLVRQIEESLNATSPAAASAGTDRPSLVPGFGGVAATQQQFAPSAPNPLSVTGSSKTPTHPVRSCKVASGEAVETGRAIRVLHEQAYLADNSNADRFCDAICVGVDGLGNCFYRNSGEIMVALESDPLVQGRVYLSDTSGLLTDDVSTIAGFVQDLGQFQSSVTGTALHVIDFQYTPEQFDPSGIEADITALDGRVDVLELTDHAQNTDTGTTAVSFELDSAGFLNRVRWLTEEEGLRAQFWNGEAWETADVTVRSAIGSGEFLTAIPAAEITGANALPDAVLSTNVPLKNGVNAFSNANTFSDSGSSFRGTHISQGGNTGITVSFVVPDETAALYTLTFEDGLLVDRQPYSP